MEPSDLSVFRRLNARMHWLSDRQSVLAENVANVDTPGFKAHDLEAPDFARTMAMTAPATVAADRPPPVNPRHVALVPQLAADGRFPTREGQEVSLNGNSVDLEHELKKSADAALEYQTMTHLYRKHMEMLRLAVQNNGS